MISIIIVNFNAGDALGANLHTLRRNWPQGVEAEIIIVDNASTDTSLAVIGLDEPGPPITVVRNDSNRGFAAACNQGIAASRGECLLFLNPDVTVEASMMLKVAAALDADTRAGMAGCRLLNPDGSEQRGARRRIPDPRSALAHLTGLGRLSPRRFTDFNQADEPLPEGPVDVEAISGAFMMVKREAMARVGLWDEGYFLHGEDLDWCLRFTQAGYRILFVPDAIAVHDRGTCSRSRPLRVEWHKHRGMWRFFRKHQAADEPVWVRMTVWCGITAHFLLRALGRGLFPSA